MTQLKKAFLIIVCVLLFTSISHAQRATDVFQASVTHNTSKLITIEFYQDVTENMEYYEVVGMNKTIMFGDSKLINALHYQPGLLAYRVIADGKLIMLEFVAKQPDLATRSDIINRVIKISQKIIAPKSQLEVDGYDPLLSLNITGDSKKVPPPIFKKKALPSGSKPI